MGRAGEKELQGRVAVATDVEVLSLPAPFSLRCCFGSSGLACALTFTCLGEESKALHEGQAWLRADTMTLSRHDGQYSTVLYERPRPLRLLPRVDLLSAPGRRPGGGG